MENKQAKSGSSNGYIEWMLTICALCLVLICLSHAGVDWSGWIRTQLRMPKAHGFPVHVENQTLDVNVENSTLDVDVRNEPLAVEIER